jgi:DNA polymerase-1
MGFDFADKLDGSGTLIVDALNLAFRWKHTQKWNTYRFDFQRTVQSLAVSYNSAKVIITADWGSSTYRKAIYPDYKGDRTERFKDQTDEEKIKFEEFFTEFAETLDLLAEDYVILRYKGVEADDLAAHLVKDALKYELDNIWLISSDRDWHLLINDNTRQFSWRSRKEITLDTWSEHYDIPIEEYISLKCLEGDKGNNIPGITGIGPKRAASLVNEYGSAMDFYDAIPIDSKYKFMQELNENAEQILLNYELMDLLSYCDEAIGDENIQDIRSKMGEFPW